MYLKTAGEGSLPKLKHGTILLFIYLQEGFVRAWSRNNAYLHKYISIA